MTLHHLAIALSLLLCAASAGADTLSGAAAVPIHRDFSPPRALPHGQELVVRGRNDGPGAAMLVIRLDDDRSDGYAGRVNEERQLPPGPFTIRLPTNGLRTPSGRRLDTDSIRRMIVFTADDTPAVAIDGVTLEPGFTLPAGAVGLDFGPPGGAVFPGFEPVTPDDPRITAGHPVAIGRPGGDALISDGLRGVERVELPLPDGRWRITLWTEDLGEWETLPHPLERRIRLNGTTVLEERLTPSAWIATRYLRGRGEEAPPSRDAWDALGSRRGGRTTAEVPVTGGLLVVELAGEGAPATFLSGLLAEPVGTGALEAVESARALRYREIWREAPEPAGLPVSVLEFGPLAEDGVAAASRPLDGEPVRLALAPGSGRHVDLLAVSPAAVAAPHLSIDPPAGPGGTRLAVRAWAGQWRLERAKTAGTLLIRTAAHLIADLDALPLPAQAPRRYALWIEVPEQASPGTYTGSATLRADGESRAVPLVVTVPAVALPAVEKPVGFYLEDPPELGWFPELAGIQQKARACDLSFLHSLGLTGVAPPLATPDRAGIRVFADDVAVVRDAGFVPPFLAYAPLKRLVSALGPDAAIEAVGRAEDELARRNLPSLAWSLADEPGNPDLPAEDLAGLSHRLKQSVPGLSRAAHLNRPADAGLLPLFDRALVNPGFGIDRLDM